MIISGDSPDGDKHYQANADNVDKEFIDKMSEYDVEDDILKRMIDRLNISADAKHLLHKFADATIRAGKFIIRIGRKIIDYVCRLFQEYPNVGFGMIFGAIAGLLIVTIPIIGASLGAFVAPLLVVFGIAKGLQEDIKDRNLARRVAEINAQFQPLNA